MSRKLFDAIVLSKYHVSYYKCPACEFIQTEHPYWLEEAYSAAISDFDIGPVDRAIKGSRLASAVINAFFDPNETFIDWGGGYGVFTRLMRDIGYDFRWQDRYCENLFAKQFVAESQISYGMLTAFEVFEHLVDPLDEIGTMLSHSENILFTTLLTPEKITEASDWWYFAPDTGQHISLYSNRAIREVAAKFGMNLYSDGRLLHLMTRSRISSMAFRVVVGDGKLARLVRFALRRRSRRTSLLEDDFRRITGWRF
jgi:hypothetical protein